MKKITESRKLESAIADFLKSGGEITLLDKDVVQARENVKSQFNKCHYAETTTYKRFIANGYTPQQAHAAMKGEKIMKKAHLHYE